MLNLECPISAVSFGQISFGITNFFFRNNIPVNLFPIAKTCDLGCFDKMPEGYENYLRQSLNRAYTNFGRQHPSLKIWHIHNGGESQIPGSSQNLLTFHELDSLTDAEINILNQYDRVFVTSTYSKQVFENYGVKAKVIYAPLGFDDVHFREIKRKEYSAPAITFSVFGKFELRKHSERVIRHLISRFANNRDYKVHLHVHNPFYKEEEMIATYNNIFNGQKPFNFELFGFLPTNSLMNEAVNHCDIVIDMSGGESISLPSLTCLALGKHGVIHNCTGMKDWATAENSVLVEPCGKIPANDGRFFAKGQPFNQGNFYTWKDEDFDKALDAVIERFKNNPINEAGKALQKVYNFNEGCNTIRKELGI